MHPRTLSLLALALCAIGLTGAALSAQPGGEATPAAVVPRDTPASTTWPAAWPAGAAVAGMPTSPRPQGAPGATVYRTGPGEGSPVVTPPPRIGPGPGTLLGVGDSVLDGAAPLLDELLDGWDVEIDAETGRSVPAGLDLLGADRTAQVVVVVLGHNYERLGDSFAWFEELRQRTRRADRVVIATVAEWSPSQVEANRAIWMLAAADPDVVVADWATVVKSNPSYLRSDEVHLTPAGNEAFAELLAVLVGEAPPRGAWPR